MLPAQTQNASSIYMRQYKLKKKNYASACVTVFNRQEKKTATDVDICTVSFTQTTKYSDLNFVHLIQVCWYVWHYCVVN